MAERKESLKNVIKKGLLPRDYVLRDALDEWIDGIYNCEDYGGSEAQYKGMSRIDVWNQSIAEVGMRTATDEDLNLMLARSTRMQKIKRNGVKIVLHGEELWYMDPTSTFKMIGQSVYVRYDPADLRYVRLYDEQDRCLCTWGLADYLYRDYLEENPDAVGDAMRILRSINGYMRDLIHQQKQRDGKTAEKVGDYSVSYADGDTAQTARQKRRYELAYMYLSRYGLMFRGVE